MVRFISVKFVRGALAAILLIIVFAAWLTWSRESISLEAASSWLHEHPIAAPMVFIVAHIFAAVLFLPCSPFTLLAGILWPFPYSLILSVAAALGASCTTFLLGRYLWAEPLRRKFKNGAAQRLMTLSNKQGWRLIAFTHINPALPSSTLGYAFGLSGISFRLYAWSALMGMLPLQVGLVAMGSAVRDVLLSRVWIATGVSMGLAITAIVVWSALKRESRKIENLKEDENDKSE